MATVFKAGQTVAILAASQQGKMFKVKIREIICECAMVTGYTFIAVPLPLDFLCTVKEAKRNIAAFNKSNQNTVKP